MKTFLVLLAAALPHLLRAQASQSFSNAERGPHHRVWQKQTLVETESGTRTNISGYTEFATGLHYWDGAQWQDSREEIEAVADGAAAIHGQHRVHWNANLNTVGAVTLTMPDGTVMRSHVLGLAYTDAATGQSVLFASIQDSDGLIVLPNEVVYPAALGLAADVRYTYRRSGLEQDILVRENLRSPADYGLNPDTTRLEVWTEFIDPPEPIKTERVLGNGLTDQSLKFRGMRMARGAAFMIGDLNAPAARTRVAKTWLKTQGNRTFLIEAVPYRAIEAELATLPPPQAALKQVEKTSRLALLNSAPRPAGAQHSSPMRMAGDFRFDRTKALVLDYVLISEDGDVTFSGDKTYYISGYVNIETAEIFGGAVLKYASEAAITITGNLSVKTRPHRMAVLTAKDDDSIGEKINGSTGTPSGWYADVLLDIQADSTKLHNLRFSRAYRALILHENNPAIEHCQFTDCNQAIEASSNTSSVDNCLFYNIGLVFEGSGRTVNGRHLTFNHCGTISSGGLTSALNVTNSILADSTNIGNFQTNFAFVSREPSASGVFQTMGGGAHYLANNSTNRNAGTTNIPGSLLTNLALRTTFPPVALTNQIISSSTNLQIMAQRCTNAPDRGYHYAALDYVYGSNVLSNATLTIPAGVVLGTFTPGSNTFGLLLKDGARIVGDGQPLNLARITRYNLVQEQANANWIGTNAGAAIRILSNGLSSPPSGTLTWTEISAPAAAAQFHADYTNRTEFVFRNSELGGGTFSTYRQQCAFTNCLFEAMTGYFYDAASSNSVINSWFNNTFVHGQATFYNSSGSPWHIFNNAFYNTADLSVDQWLLHGWNAYRVGMPMVGGWSSNSVITNFSFASGLLGEYYLAANSPLLNRGTNNATNYGLFHFTALAAQTKETNSTTDIGFHYAALNGDASYIDSDDDGLPDWYEDANGNGSGDTNAPNYEMHWQKWSTAGDELSDNYFTIYFEYQNRTKDSQNQSEPQGTVIRGKGFRVYGTWTSGPYGSLSFLFEQMYRGLHLNTFTTNDGDLSSGETWATEYQLPSTNVNLRYLVKYDFNTFRLVVSNSTDAILDRRIWRDNMMDALGSGGPNSVTNAAYLIQGAKFTPAPFPPKRRYVWEGSVGNTSQELTGPSVHSVWWPIMKMASKGTNVFYTCGYNEGHWNIQRFNTNNFQFVNTNFSWNRQIQLNFVYPVDMALDSAGTTLYVKLFDQDSGTFFTSTFNADTCAIISTNAAGWPSFPSLAVSTNGASAVAVHPDNTNVAAVYYAATEQVVVYTNATSHCCDTNYVIGLVNGYSNGPAILIPTNTATFRQNVKLSGYYFDKQSKVTRAVLCFQSDGHLWVSDSVTSRMLRFDTNGMCDGWFMYQPHSYCAFANVNEPTRVFNQYLEFRVDYSKPLQTGWVLTNYWGRTNGTPRGEIERGNTTEQGVYYVTTLTNSGTPQTFCAGLGCIQSGQPETSGRVDEYRIASYADE